MFGIGITADNFHIGADALGRTVAALFGIGRTPYIFCNIA
jgi:hypothetical protein